jgi:hypothetical protein
MDIDITPEVIVAQLNLGHGETTLNQAKTAINNTKDFGKFSKHIISLNDKLKHMNGYIALSNSAPYFKIKCDNIESDEILKEFTQELNHWSKKYEVELEKVDKKDVYYIIGKN